MTDTAARGAGTPFFVVGIGASAGGLEALERFFESVPEDSGMAYVVIQHLSPDFRSVMDELLARHTRLPIRLVENGMPIEANHVYLIPPKKEMIVSGGRLLLAEREPHGELAMPINVFFRSLAQDVGKRAIAIVLSGGGSDGTRGIKYVHEAGGLVLVQDVESAQFDGMPKMAREAGVASWVLPPGDMPRVLMEYARKTRETPDAESSGNVATLPAVEAIYDLLQQEYGIDFTHYKPSTVTRRIERRLRLARADDAQSYLERVRRHRDELDVLYRDLLIGVTRFFRNEGAFDVLENRVLPELFARGHRDDPLRIWVAGCATGEEVYSLGIVAHEIATRSFGDRPIKIFASDVHRGSLEIAARAIYDAQAMKNVSSARLERYFVRRGDAYQVVPEIRQQVVFAPHNVINDAPFTRMDLISCRNLLIYLQPSAQQKVLSVFHFALSRGGIVFLGPSESPGSLLRDFETVDNHWRVYRKFSDVRTPIELRFRKGGDPTAGRILAAPTAQSTRWSLAQLLGTYDALLDEYMPPSLLLTEHGEVVHAFRGASKFLKLRDGRQSLDVLDTVDTELKMVLVGGIKRALKEPNAIVFVGVRVREGEGDGSYRVTIRRVTSRAQSARHVLVTFELDDAVLRPRSETEIDVGQMSRDQLAALETELTYTKENLQAAIEELETGNEELQAANEELLASNEELQSTNEELQSVNEELYTVNAEYQRKIGELTELTNDIDNLLASTEMGTLFLDPELRIRKLTPRIADTFNLLPQDVGRPLDAFTHTIDHPGLMDDLKSVLAGAPPIEREIRDRKGRSFILRVLPYRAKGATHGVVLTLLEVTNLKRAEDELFHERHLLNSLMLSVPDAIYFRDRKGRFIRVNAAMAGWLGLGDPREALGKTAYEICPREIAASLHDEDERVAQSGEPQLYRLERHTRNGAEEWHVVTRLPLRDPRGAVVGVIGIYRNVTELKRAEQRVHEAVQRRDQFLAMLSHELRNPLGAIVTATALLAKRAKSNDDEMRLISIVDRQSQQMSHLLDDLLEASRVTQNKIELRRQVLDLAAVVRDASDAARGMTESRGVTLETDIASDPIWVDGDAARLQQLQMNMLSNAAKYTPRDGHVKLSVRREGEHAVIRVKDDGVGIPSDMLDAVFDLFVQSHSTLDRADGGLGLGLTLVRSLVQMHGGTVSAHSDGPGKGSEFVVRLPITAPPGKQVVPSRALVWPTDARGRVVIVEDNLDSREMLQEMLSIAGFECHSAEDGPRALQILGRVKPNVAIVDVGLPGMDGFELARLIRKDSSLATMYLVALTGYGQAADRARAIDAGFDEHLVKPVSPESLMRLLARGREATN